MTPVVQQAGEPTKADAVYDLVMRQLGWPERKFGDTLTCHQCDIRDAAYTGWCAALASRPLIAQKYDDTLLPFLALMRRELHANSGKGDRPGWLTMSREQGLLEIYWHAAKLSVAVKKSDEAAIAEHSADVANMAMMLADVCGVLAHPNTTPQPQAETPLTDEQSDSEASPGALPLVAQEPGHALPTLPEPAITSYQTDSTMRASEVRSYSATQMREYAILALAHPPEAEPALWQYRWLNPRGADVQPPEMTEWKELKPSMFGQTMQERIAEIRAFRYQGETCYEVRALVASPLPPEAQEPKT